MKTSWKTGLYLAVGLCLTVMLWLTPPVSTRAASPELTQAIDAFEFALKGGSPKQKQEAAIRVLKNYREYQKLLGSPGTASQVSATTVKALDEQLIQMTQKTWSEVGKRHYGGLSHVVPVGTLGSRNAQGSKYKPGFSDKDFLPRGSQAPEAARDFNKAFERQWGISPGTVDVNVLDPTDATTWQGRVAAAANPEKYNTRGGITWLENSLHKSQPDVWTIGARGELETVPYSRLNPVPPRPPGAEDALGMFSDNARFRQQWLTSGNTPADIAEHVAKYEQRSVEAFELAGGQLTKEERRLVMVSQMLRKNRKEAALGWAMQLTGETDPGRAMNAYLEATEALNERMSQTIVRNHVARIRAGTAGPQMMNELAASLANLPAKYADDAEKQIVAQLGKVEWQNVSKLSSIYKQRVQQVRYGLEYMDEVAKRYFGKPYHKLDDAERLILHGADDAVEGLGTKTFKALGVGAGVVFGIYAIRESYKQGIEAGGSGYGEAFGRACIELLQAGYPPLIAAELTGRIMAGVTEVCASEYTSKQLDEMYAKLKSDPSLQVQDLLDTYGVDRFRAGALRQMAIEIREEHPGATEQFIEAKIRTYFERRLATEEHQKAFDEFARKAEAWVTSRDIPLEAGVNWLDADKSNEEMKQNDPDRYYAAMGNLMSQYHAIRREFQLNNRPFTENDIWYELYKLYRGAPPLDGRELAGAWQNGVLVLAEFPGLTGQPQQQIVGDSEGCGLPADMAEEVIRKLKGRPLPLSLHLTAQGDGSAGSMQFRVIPPSDLRSGDDDEVEIKTVTLQYQFHAPDSLTAEGTIEGENGYLKFNAGLEVAGDQIVLDGTWSASPSRQKPAAILGTWKATRPRLQTQPAPPASSQNRSDRPKPR
jgi:hypothetical protein